MAEQAIRITLSTGKVVLMRIPKIKHQEQAMRVVGKSAGDNNNLFQFMTGIELMKLLIAKINDKDMKYQDMTNLDDHFTNREIKEMGLAVQEYTKEGDDFLPKIEAVAIGG
jgi:hypothetical protein